MQNRVDNENLLWSDRLLAGAVALSVFAVYALGAARTIYVGDSGELVTAVHVLGVPHPTGYPLYVLLGKLWALAVPIGSIAFRMSLFSAACAALACAVLFLICRRLGSGQIAALTAALALAFAPSFWDEATVQRVYALNALGLAVAVLLAIEWARRPTAERLAAAVFVAALAASNHTFMLVFLAAFAVYALVVNARAVLQARPLGMAAIALVAGLLPYLHLPIAAARRAAFVWGDPESLEGFLDIVLRREFWDRAWVASAGDVATVAADYLLDLARELAWIGVPLALAGAAVALRRQRIAVLIGATMLANVAVLALHGSREDLFVWHRYYIPSHFMAALLVGLGADALVRRVPPLLRVVPLAVPLLLVTTGWAAHDRSRYRIAEDFSRGLLAELPPNTTLHAADDNILFVLFYLTLVERYRDDVAVVVHGSVELPPAAELDPVATPIFFTHPPALEDPDLAAVPVGLAYRLWPADRPFPAFELPPDELPGESDPSVPKDYQTQHLIGHYHFMLGLTLEQQDWPRAEEHLRRAAAAAPDDDVLFYSLSLVYLRNGLYDEAIAALERSHEINPRDLAVGGDFRAADLLELVRGERDRIAALEVALLPPEAAPADAAARHRRLAELLAERGEPAAARGHLLRADRVGNPAGP